MSYRSCSSSPSVVSSCGGSAQYVSNPGARSWRFFGSHPATGKCTCPRCDSLPALCSSGWSHGDSGCCSTQYFCAVRGFDFLCRPHSPFAVLDITDLKRRITEAARTCGIGVPSHHFPAAVPSPALSCFVPTLYIGRVEIVGELF